MGPGHRLPAFAGTDITSKATSITMAVGGFKPSSWCDYAFVPSQRCLLIGHPVLNRTLRDQPAFAVIACRLACRFRDLPLIDMLLAAEFSSVAEAAPPLWTYLRPQIFGHTYYNEGEENNERLENASCCNHVRSSIGFV